MKQHSPFLTFGTCVWFLGRNYWKKGILFASFPKQISFLTISNENIFFKTQATRLDAIVTPNKRLKQALNRQEIIDKKEVELRVKKKEIIMLILVCLVYTKRSHILKQTCSGKHYSNHEIIHEQLQSKTKNKTKNEGAWTKLICADLLTNEDKKSFNDFRKCTLNVYICNNGK